MTDLTSKTVFAGFIAAWFFAASPMRRSSSVKDTNEGVVKLPCSFATVKCQVIFTDFKVGIIHTDFNIAALIVSDARVGSA